MKQKPSSPSEDLPQQNGHGYDRLTQKEVVSGKSSDTHSRRPLKSGPQSTQERTET